MVSLYKNHKPTTKENKDTYILMKSMYMIKELYDRRRDSYIRKKYITILSEIESGEYNPCLDVVRSPFDGSYLQHTHLCSNALNEEDPQSDLIN
jgi:hypothetical protein